MKLLFFLLFALIAVALAAPQYQYQNGSPYEGNGIGGGAQNGVF